MDSGCSTSMSISDNGSNTSSISGTTNNIRLVNNDEMSHNSDTSSSGSSGSPPLLSDNGLPESMNKLIEYVMSAPSHPSHTNNMYQYNRTLSTNNLNMSNNMMMMNVAPINMPMASNHGSNVVFHSNQTLNHIPNHNGFNNNINNTQISHSYGNIPSNYQMVPNRDDNNDNPNSFRVKYQLLYIDPSMPPIVISQNVV
eukprot:CAMPEP_0201596368 /NCGR_PEP_ID=MMETSP0190_2-20130828/193070_1 /ASSEMBLY_ACC=CAM_ASM_000263 /TAXON_ID=37353 /ORGANISM="Rosalina sp." /LENGTH=197 /DNA_ID=CAMNT_0048056681 /DNA_START=1242 /DNA_END=1835 /DNA_ORIENTATION=-